MGSVRWSVHEWPLTNQCDGALALVGLSLINFGIVQYCVVVAPPFAATEIEKPLVPVAEGF